MSNDSVRRALARKCAASVILVGVVLLAACGGGSENAKTRISAGSVTAEDVERDLKFDARVSDFETEGNKLVVNVNEHWMSSPAGMQQTAVKRWLSRWQAAKAGNGGNAPKDAKVEVRFGGKPILTAAEDGVSVLAKANSDEAK